MNVIASDLLYLIIYTDFNKGLFGSVMPFVNKHGLGVNGEQEI